MLFNSIEFLIFLPVVFLLYWFAFNRKLVWQNAFLLIASYFFYGWWSWSFMGLLMLSTLLDYGYGFGVASTDIRKSKFFLWLSIINNLGILAVFKYYNFFATQFQAGFEELGLHINPVLLNIALPVGISFYTFHGMSYVFDIYRGKQKPIANFVDYAVFVSFFPLLVAGPIERAHHLLPQVQRKRNFDYQQAVDGCRLMLWGFFKKVVIADQIAVGVDEIFRDHAQLSTPALLLGAFGFAIQIYGDFSGYTDIALGTAKLFGFELLSNFKFPYFSRDIAEFWRRWHISLSSWFRDYLYIPLGGSKNGKNIAIRNTFIIFLVSGFWHGANWTFIVWGLIHAVGFLPLLLMNKNRTHTSDVVAQDRMLPNARELFQMLTTFAFVTFAWIFFRAENLGQAWSYLMSLLNNWNNTNISWKTGLDGRSYMIIWSAILLVCDWTLRHNERSYSVRNKPIRQLIYFLLFFLIWYHFNQETSFIYFQF